MRTGWADNPRLRDLVQRTDPGAHLFAEVVKFADSSVKILQSHWAAGTTTGSIDNPESGGARLNAGTNADITQTSDDGTEISGLTPIPDFDAILVEWTDAQAEERELKNFVARLDPRPDNGQAKDVAEWRAQAFRVVELGPEDDRRIIMPISREVIVVSVGEAVANIDFDFWDGNEYPRVGPPPTYHPDFNEDTPTRPQTIIRIIALDSDGAPASNVAWMADSTLTGTISGSGYVVRHYEFIPPDSRAGDETGGAVWSIGSLVGNMPRFTLNRPIYAAGSVTFDGGEAIPDLSGTGDLEIVAHGRTPSGSSLTFKIWNGAAYIECKSADLIGVDNSDQGGEDLSGVSTTGPWDIQVLLTPSASGRSTPTAREFGVRRVVTTNLAGLATIRGGRYRIEPMSLKGNIPKAEITILKTGARDFRDYGTTILAENHIGEIEVRLWIGDPSGVYLNRSEWMHHSSWEVEDYRNGDAGHVLECVSPIRRLRTPIPEFIVTGGTDGERTQIEYTNQTPKAVWEDLVDGRVGLPGRFRGPGIESTAYTISKLIKEADAKDELDRVAYLVGYANIESQGRLRAVPVMRDGVGAGTPVAIFPIGSYDPVYIGPGFKTRTDEFFVSLDWDEVSQSFETEVRKFNATAFIKLGGAGLNTTQKLEAETAKWIDTDALALDVANRVPMHFGNGLIIWELMPIYLHPHLEVGDVVGVLTDQFVGRSPITDREIRGPVATLAIVVDTHGELWGRHISVWVPTFDGIVTSEGDITWLNYKQPRFDQAEVVFLPDGSARFRGQTIEGVAVRGAYSDTDFPNTATVEGEDLEVVDSVYYFDFEIAAAGVFDQGETIWVSAHAYEKADGTGSRSTPIFQVSAVRPGVPRLEVDVDLITDNTKVTFAARCYLGETLSGTVEFLDPERTFTTAGAITATDKTLVITGGDLTDEDVGKYISVAGAGAGGILLTSRIDSVTSATECELEDAAGTTVANATTILGGGPFDDFDYSGTAGDTETNFRNRPASGRDSSYITLQGVVGGQTSSPQTFLLNPQVEAKLLTFSLFVVDDQGVSGDDQYTFSWTLSAGVTDSYSIDLEGGKEDDRGTPLVTGSETSPATNLSKQLDDTGAGDGLDTPKHWGRAILKDPSGNPIGQLEEYNVIPAV